MTHKKVENLDTGTIDKFGGNDLDKWSDFASGLDVDDYDINSDTQYRYDKLQIRNSGNTFGHKHRSLATVARTITYPDADITVGEGGAGSGISGYKYFIFLDPADNKFKARNGKTGAIDYTSTDGTACGAVIQQAIDANSNAPGIIEFASNTTFPLEDKNLLYTFSGTTYPETGAYVARYSLFLRPGIWIKGGGWTTKILACTPTATNNGVGIFIGDGGRVANTGDIIISDIWLEGRCVDGHTNRGSSGNVKLLGFDRVIMHRIKSRNASQSNLQTQYSNYVSITDCYAEGSELIDPSGPGIGCIMVARASHDAIISNNFVKNAGGESIGLYYSPNNFQITNNTCIVTLDSPLLQSYGRGQLHIENSTTELPTGKFGVVSGNTVWSNYHGCVLLSTSFVDISNNVFRSTGFTNAADPKVNVRECIELVGESMCVNIHDNLIYDTSSIGIYIETVRNVNFFPAGNLSGINIHDNVIVNSGRSASNTYDGINLIQSVGDGDMVDIHDNMIIDQASTPLMRDGVRVTVNAGRTLNNLMMHHNIVKGQLGLATNVINSGTITYAAPLTVYLDDIQDVALTFPFYNHRLVYNGLNWINAPPSPTENPEFKSGEWYPLTSTDYSTGIITEGVTVTASATVTRPVDAVGRKTRIETLTTTANPVGLTQTVARYRLNYYSRLYAYFIGNSGSSGLRYFIGFQSATTPPISDTPFDAGIAGIFVALRLVDNGTPAGTLKVLHNDATGSTVVDDTGIAYGSSGNRHRVEIALSPTDAKVYIDEQLTNTITADLPAATTDLYPFWFCHKASGPEKSIEIYKAGVVTR